MKPEEAAKKIADNGLTNRGEDALGTFVTALDAVPGIYDVSADWSPVHAGLDVSWKRDCKGYAFRLAYMALLKGTDAAVELALQGGDA